MRAPPRPAASPVHAALCRRCGRCGSLRVVLGWCGARLERGEGVLYRRTGSGALALEALLRDALDDREQILGAVVQLGYHHFVAGAELPGQAARKIDGDAQDLARAIGDWCTQPWPSERVREARAAQRLRAAGAGGLLEALGGVAEEQVAEERE